jgi:hypothetical protein
MLLISEKRFSISSLQSTVESDTHSRNFHLHQSSEIRPGKRVAC